MGEYKAISFAAVEESSNSASLSISKPAKYCYTRNFLLSIAEHETCKRRPDDLDPVLWRDSPPLEVLDGGVAIPLSKIRGVVRRDRESDIYINWTQEVPEWRKDSWRPGSSGSSGCGAGQQSLRRKAYDEEVGSTFSTSYPPRPAASWGENGHLRNFDRSAGPSASGQARWEHRPAAGDRDRERRSFQDLDSEDLDIGNRLCGVSSGQARSGWVPSERDGLLGSGGGPRGALTSGLPGHTSRYNGGGRNGRSYEQYQLPKQAKPASNLRRDETDFVNDETFGFDEPTSEERAEQERSRRESFELMRKQHLRQVQELKDKHPTTDGLTANTKNDENCIWENQGCLNARAGSPPQSPGRSIGFSFESPTSALPSQISAHSSTPRPAVPPGFAKAMPLRTPSEVGNKERNLLAQPADSTPTEATDDLSDFCSGSQTITQAGICLASSDCSETHGQHRGIEVASSQTLKMVSTSTASYPPLKTGSNETADGWNLHFNGILLSNTEELGSGGLKCIVEGQGSVCNEPFVKVQGDNNIPVPVLTEDKVSDGEDTWCNPEEKVSNLAHWFDTKETPGENILSLFSKSVTTSKIRARETSQLKQVVPFNSLSPKHQTHVLPMPAGPSLEDVEKGIAATEMDVVLHNGRSAVGGGLAKFPPVFLRCQDIELSIIAEAGQNVERNPGAFLEQPPAAVKGPKDIVQFSPSLREADGKASLHLMSLLRRLPLADEKSSSSTKSLKLDLGEAREQSCKDEDLIKDDVVVNWVSEDQDQGRLCMQPTVAQEFQTLESLFGKAFMNELRAQDKPVSMKTCPDQLPLGEDITQLPSMVSHFRQSEAGSNFTSKTTFGTIGRAFRQGVSDARDVRVPDLCRGNLMIQSCNQDLASPDTGELWSNSYPPSGEAIDDSARIVIKHKATESQKPTCPRQAYGGSLEKICDSTGVVQDVMNHSGEVGQGYVCFDENVETETSRNGEAAIRVSMAKVEAGILPITSGNNASSVGSLVEGAQEQSVVPTRSSLASVEWKAFQGGGGLKSTSADGSSFSLDTYLHNSSGEGLEHPSRARIMEATSGPDLASGGYSGGHQFQHRATPSPQFKANSGQAHQSIIYSGFQPQLLQPLQAGLPAGVLYRPLSPPVVGLHSHSAPVHHQLQQPLMSQAVAPGRYLGFSHPPYQSPQPQQQMLPQFGSGGAIEFPHFGFRPVPDSSGRSFSHHGSASGSLRFQPPLGHLSQQGGYHMRPVGAIPNQFVGAAQGPQRNPFFQVMNAGPFIHDHPLHEPTISLAAKQGQPALPLFPVSGSSVHSGPNAMVHQPGHNGRAGPPGPHLAGHPLPLGYVSGVHYVSDSGHASKGQDFPSYQSNNGKVGGTSGLDRWHGC